MPDKRQLLVAFAPVFGLLGLSMIVSLLILGWLGITVTPGSFRTFGLVVLMAATLVGAAWRWGHVTALSSGLSAALFLLIPAPMAMFSYAMAGLGAARPLFDADLARVDALMGFDWLATVAFVNQFPLGVKLLGHAYHGTIAPLIYLLVFLNVVGRHDRLVEFAWMFTGTCLLASAMSALWPAMGAYIHFRPDDTLRSAISGDAGVWHLVHFEQLRAGTFRVFSLAQTEGLVTFPSFHTAAALVIPLALRGYGILTGLAWACAVAVLVSTVPIGGHYLVDVLAGAAVTLAMSRVVRAWVPSCATETGLEPAVPISPKALAT